MPRRKGEEDFEEAEDLEDEELDDSQDDSEDFINDEREKGEVEDDFSEDDFSDDDLNDDEFYGEGGEPPIDKHKDLLKDLTNFNPYLRDTVNNWLGLVWDEEAQTTKRNKYLKPVMNRNGASWCIGVLKTYTRGNNIITDIGSDHFRFIMEDHIDNTWLNLGTRDDLGIKSNGDLIRVNNELEHAAGLVLMGAGDGKYNKFLGSTYSYHGNDSPQNLNNKEQVVVKKGGMIGKIKKMIVGE